VGEQPLMRRALRPALFLDRDGVINHEVNYLHRPEDVELIPGVAEAIHQANALEIPVIVATNQAGIARGKYGLHDLAAVGVRIDQLLGHAKIDATYYCPHHPDGVVSQWRLHCECRKPHPGMLLQAAHEHSIELAKSIFVGDKQSDLSAARAAGCGAVLVRTGYGAEVERALGPDHPLYDQVFDSLMEAMPYIMARLKSISTNCP
jgi:D-glycero-D-manno-heptose 1,7-bisphosphate phosphatase